MAIITKIYSDTTSHFKLTRMATLAELKDELEPYKGTLVIGNWDNIVLLKDVIDGGDDFYWVYYGYNGFGNCEYHATCVGSWVPLKGFVLENKYQRLVTIWNLNNDPENQAI